MSNETVKTERKILTESEARELLKAQNVKREDVVVICPRCGTPQTPKDFMEATGKSFEEIEKYFGISCIGRLTKSKGCDWSLYGLLHIHNTEIKFDDGNTTFYFDIATPEQVSEYYKQGEANEQ